MNTLTQVKERPILFSGDLVRAILEGRKTMTRRPVKPQPANVDGFDDLKNGELVPFRGTQHSAFAIRCPYGQPGDRLWVRETFVVESNWGLLEESDPPFNDGRPVRWHTDPEECKWWSQAHYAATDPLPELINENCRFQVCDDNGMCQHWSPSIHMPRWASRITLEITNVRVERIQGIKPSEMIAEGYGPPMFGDGVNFVRRLGAFTESWNATYPGSWDRNDWVWVIGFKRIEGVSGAGKL